MNELLQQIVNGIAWGSLYALIALGYTMVYGVLRLINFAHGDVYMIGAMVAYYAARTLLAPETSSAASFFALLAHCARGVIDAPAYPGLGRKGGVVGVLTGALGFSSGGCTVIGCGAPVIPVVGLAFTGLTSGTLAALAETSRIATAFIFVAATFGVVWLGWLAGEKGDAHLFPKSL